MWPHTQSDGGGVGILAVHEDLNLGLRLNSRSRENPKG